MTLRKIRLKADNMFTQSDQIRDYVFPIATVASIDNSFAFKEFLGTGFLIGNRGFALTAAHVVQQFDNQEIVAMFVLDSGEWLGVPIKNFEMHKHEDVAVIKVQGNTWKSLFKLSNTFEGSAVKYRMFGYPDDIIHEIVSGGRAQPRPDLIYTEGYVRRRVSFELPAVIGTSFFELSDVAGPGCSGSPIFKFTKPTWDVIGIYVGEKINGRATSVAYAVREESFREWIPNLLGTSILAESQNVSLPQ